MQNEILNFFGRIHAQYIHARGERATRVLIQSLNCRPGEKILEIGCGTGTTLVQLFSNNRKTRFYGIDLSPLMLKKAKARLRFCMTGDSVKFSLMKHKTQIPFESNTFDKIYLESVLGIQEGDDLKNILKEIRRVLRPNGSMVINETIWLDSTPPEEIIRINDLCKSSFGIVQCTSHYPYLKDWIDLLTSLDFKSESVIKLDEVKNDIKSEFRFPYRLLSLAFTASGKIKSYLVPSMRSEKKEFYQKMKLILPNNTPIMGGILIKARIVK